MRVRRMREDTDAQNVEGEEKVGLLIGVDGRGGESLIHHFSVLSREFCLSFGWMTKLSSLKKTYPLTAFKLFTCSFLSVTSQPRSSRGSFATGQSKGQVSSLKMKRVGNIGLLAFSSLKIKRILFAFKIHAHLLGRIPIKNVVAPTSYRKYREAILKELLAV